MVIPNKFYYDIEEIITHWKIFNPTRCHELGIHEYDGLLPNYSYESIQDRIREIKEDIIHLIALRRDYPDPYTKFEFNLVKFTLEHELYELSDLKQYENNPVFYIPPFYLLDQSFTVRNFASIDERIKIINEFLHNIPIFLQYPTENLKTSLPDILINFSIQSLSGIIKFLQNKLPDFVQKSSNNSLIQENIETTKLAIDSLLNFKNDLEQNYKPHSHKNYALGKDKFIQMLKKTENIVITADQLKKIGEDELEKHFTSLQSLLSKHEPNYFGKIQNEILQTDEIFTYASQSIKRVLTFLNEKKLFDIPLDESCIVAETPESTGRYGFAGINSTGPFEVSKDSVVYFYLTLPDPSWTKTQIQNYLRLFNVASFDLIVISEVYPGQFLKILYEKYRTKSIISNLFSRSFSMIEGYSEYVQELMIEEGYNPFEDPDKILIGQLLITLLRNVRFLVTTGIHCFNMTFEEGKKIFMEKAYLSEELAIAETNRAIISPMYLNYTLGRLLIKKLRDDYKKQQGEDFSLRKFHDELLGLGSAPITLLREIMLKDSNIVSKVL